MVLGIFGRDPVPGMRKKYDKAREKADKLKDKNRKLEILRLLDQIEPTLIALEEQEIPKFEKRRRISYVKDGVDQAHDMLAMKQ